MITYKYLKNTNIAVYLEGKRVGTIKQFAYGCRYYPKGYETKHDGVIYKSLKDCKKALESE